MKLKTNRTKKSLVLVVIFESFFKRMQQFFFKLNNLIYFINFEVKFKLDNYPNK